MDIFVIAFVLAALLVGATAAAPGRSLVVHDPQGDTRARDLDIRTVALPVDGPSLRARITLAAPVRDNAIYSVNVICQGIRWQLSTKKAAGETTIFRYNVEKPRSAIPGAIVGRTVSLIAPADAMASAKGRLKFSVTAEGIKRDRPTRSRRASVIADGLRSPGSRDRILTTRAPTSAWASPLRWQRHERRRLRHSHLCSVR